MNFLKPSRRGFLAALGIALVAAPSIVRASNLMRISVQKSRWIGVEYLGGMTFRDIEVFDLPYRVIPEFRPLTTLVPQIYADDLRLDMDDA